MVNNLKFVKYSKNLTTQLDKKFNKSGEKDFNILLEKHTRLFTKSENRFLKGINPNFKKEIIFNLDDYTRSSLKLGLTTGLMAKALQNGYVAKSEKPIVLQGLLITRDNKVVLGLRNKPKFREKLPDEKNDFKLMLCPAGYATFNKKKLLTKSFYKELEEELGLFESDIDKIEIMGHNNDIGFTEGIRLSIYAKTDLSFQEIKKKWKNAKHGWEYADLMGIEFTKDSISKLLRTKDFSAYSEKVNGLVDSSIRPVLEFILIMHEDL